MTATASHWPVPTLHSPLKQPCVSPEQSFGAPPPHTPAVQVSPTEHRSSRLEHGSPSLPGTGSHMPLLGLHTETWQSLGTGSKKQSFATPPVHKPLLQVVPTTHRSAETQSMPLAAGVVLQSCDAS